MNPLAAHAQPNDFYRPNAAADDAEGGKRLAGYALRAPGSGVAWSVISAGTQMTVAPLLAKFLLFQRRSGVERRR